MRGFDMLQPGATVWRGDEQWVILDLAGFDVLEARNVDTGVRDRLNVSEIRVAQAQPSKAKLRDLVTIAEEAWRTASERMKLIQPLVDKGPYKRTLDDVKEVAAEADRHYVTIYRWLVAYESTMKLSSLLRKERNDKGSRKLDPKVEKIIADAIQEIYLKEERPDLADLIEEIERRCSKQKLKVPHRDSIRARIAALSPHFVESKRVGRKLADRKYSPQLGSFPGADFPLAVVQIDHTPVDLILVDEIDREALSRPYLTIAIDVFSRMVVGYLLTFDPPGAMSTGLSLSHAILPKERYLADLGIEAQWPCRGLMRKVHADNAKEFRGTMLSRACSEYGITLENRPRGTPHYGGHVERCFRTFLKKVHRLPGTTFSDVAEKLNYDSKGKAIMTLSEFNKWFTIFVLKYYHLRYHRGLQTTPLARWEEGIFGSDDRLGVGLPAPIADEERLRLDFLPYVERTIQETGVQIDRVDYYSDVLRKWICSPDPNDIGKSRKFIFRRDPRDISVIWFLDPDTSTYVEIPYRDTTLPPVSEWELRAATRRVREKGKQAVDQQSIFEAIEEMRQIEQAAAKKTSSVRRSNARRRENQKVTKTRVTKAKPEPMVPVTKKLQQSADGMFEDLADIQPFESQAAK